MFLTGGHVLRQLRSRSAGLDQVLQPVRSTAGRRRLSRRAQDGGTEGLIEMAAPDGSK
jgi:hypothetical protein